MIKGVFGILITILLYIGIRKAYRHFDNKPLLSPLFITPIVLVAILLWQGIPYENYHLSAKYLTNILQPATIALAIPLYKYFELLKKNFAKILISIFFGTIVAITSTAAISGLFNLNGEMANSMIPHSVTASIAIDISQSIGGIPAITAVFVVLTGIIGSIIGPIIIKYLRIENCIARGVLLGTSAHASGTSKAFEFGSISGTISSVSMILTGIFTIFAAPIFVSLISL
ncbi:MAG: LrgB family protein [Desulfitobacterium sp.]|nr:LrgB family protein [Desulfitobacterium sp.]